VALGAFVHAQLPPRPVSRESTAGAGRLLERLFAPIDSASLVVFRVAFGAILFWEVTRYFSKGWIPKYWIQPAFHFTYPGFYWVQPWPGMGMYVHMAALGVLAAMIAAGAFYRLTTILFFLGFTYTFLLEHTLYLNHLYFVSLVSFLMIFVPAHRAWSVDARLGRVPATNVIPAWPLWLLRGQLGIVYFYAGIAKLNSDWFRGEPLRSWLAEKAATPGVGWIFERPETFYFLSWGGLAFDLFIVPFLLWRRARVPAFLAAVFFHLMNVWFFNIGIFPWFSIAMTTLFFSPDWPRRLWQKMRASSESTQPTVNRAASLRTGTGNRGSFLHERRITGLLVVYFAFQLLIPLRHWLYPGDVTWTEEGHAFSWRMKLRSKSGDAVFVVTNPATRESWQESPDAYLEPWQIPQMIKRPELIRQFAHHLRARKEKEIGAPVEVRVHTAVRLNDHPPAPIVDPDVDLSREPYRIGSAPWIIREPASAPPVLITKLPER
jgi:vitamin K-dependent gamma-carboxylase